jgi:RHS repeat-associated protein
MQENHSQSSNNQENNNQDPSRQVFSSSFAQQNNHQIPEIKLPKGGGALKGIDEKFEVNPVNGTNSVSIPLPVAPARGGFSPSLAIQYSSGGGNGLFGIGWGVGIPSIRRKTDKQLPQYHDAAESDTFILAGAEDLVQKYKQDKSTGNWIKQERPRTVGATVYTIQEYRPRIEGAWLRIERWTAQDTGIIHWRTISTNNTITVYGDSSNSRIANPQDPDRQVFEWLVSHSYDNMGNILVYEYKEEDLKGVANTIFEKNRTTDNVSNRYLKRVHYGNRKHYHHGDPLPDATEFLFETVFDYGEHTNSNTPTPTYQEIGTWKARPDAFSSFRSGFDIRTYRLCERVMLFHKFDGDHQDVKNLLVSTLELTYQDYPDKAPSPTPLEGFTYLKEAISLGYLYENGAYRSKPMPPLSFYYQAHAWDTTIHTLDEKATQNLPTGINQTGYRWMDLYGEGISGILSEKNQAWFYQQNLGQGEFTPIELLTEKPSFQGLGQGLQFQDLEGSGEKQVVNWATSPQGFFNYKDGEKWEGFQHFEQVPNRNLLNDPNARFIDLDGDGRPDLLITENELLEWYPSAGKKGFGKANQLSKPLDEEEGARIVFADQEQSIFLADMTGDGMTDIVRIKNGAVCYWANQGYGHFSAKITMADAPLVDYTDQFNPQYILLTDIDGSGTTDIAYLGKDHIHIWVNHNGNSFAAAPKIIHPFPTIDSQTQVDFIDLLGTGTPCIVWSSMGMKDTNTPLKYINLTASKKPHLLHQYENNTGAAVQFEYVSSTHFYLEDKKAGKPWATKLPFPIHVVCKTTATDYIRNTVFSSKYSYHHGYYDRLEREFRGFGRVEQLDTEDFNQLDAAASNIHLDHFQVPIKSVSWYHTGASFKDKKLSEAFAAEYFQNPSIEQPLEGTILPQNISNLAYHEAYRACKGLLLHQEVYSLDIIDNPTLTELPYGTSGSSYEVQQVQPHLDQQYASFIVVPIQAMNYSYERNPADPRISQNLVLETNDLGMPTKTASIIYPRFNIPTDLPWMVQAEQEKIHASFTEISLTKDIDDVTLHPDEYRLRTSYEEKIHEVLGLGTIWSPNDTFFSPSTFNTTLAGSTAIAFEDDYLGTGIATRLSGHGKAQFLDNDLQTPLPFGEQASLGIPYKSYQLANTPRLRKELYTTDNQLDLLSSAGLNLPSDGHFVDLDGTGNWWIPSGTTIYDTNPNSSSLSINNFYIPLGVEDILGNQTTIELDRYQLLPISTTDPLGNSIQTVYDYRVLQPILVTDPNENQAAVAYDELGIVVKSAMMGKNIGNTVEGDTLDHPTAIMEYDFFRWKNTQHTANPQPNYIHSSVREEHHSQNPNSAWQESYEYSDGGGAVIMAKVQTKDGDALQWDANTQTLTTVKNVKRWIGNGRTIIDNKGNPIKQYEPYFSVTHEFEDAPALVEIGFSPILYYDAAGRNNKTLLPNGTFTKVEFDAWQNTSYDVNDTVLDSTWYSDALASTDVSLQRAANLTAQHANTPTHAYLDCLGRTIYAENIAPNPSDNTAMFTQTDMAGRYSKVYDQIATNQLLAQPNNYNTARGYSSYSKTDLLGQAVYTETAVKGKSYALTDAMGRMLRIWDNPDSPQSLEFRTKYDVLHRPLETYVKQGTQPQSICFAKTKYGESLTNPEQRNLRGQAYQSWDQAGLMTSQSFDFKGNPLVISRQLTEDHTRTIDWNQTTNQLHPTDIFETSSEYDALSRPTLTTLPDGTHLKPTYNKGGYLEKLEAEIMGRGGYQTFLNGQDYDAKGQKQWVQYGNETITKYLYEAKTFRLANLVTLHKDHQDNVPHTLQDLQYQYDPSGNIMEVKDKAQSTFYYNNQVISPEKQYEYDHLYRLTRATGREHISSGAPVHEDFGHLQGLPSQHINTAARSYTQTYEYDAADNITLLQHKTGSGTGSWSRTYQYATNATNNLEATKLSTANATTARYEDYDIHGNMTKMPHLQALTWNFADELVQVEKTGVVAYYNYDGRGQRIRKVVQKGTKREERLYLGGVERYRVYDGNNNIKEETWTLHIEGIAQVDTKTIQNSSSVASPQPFVRYQYTDHLGSATLETNADAEVISYEEYHPYGTTAYSTYVNTNSYSTKRFRFTNKERDDETGLYYFGVRYYAAWLGRWTSSDPGDFIDGLNLYRYVRNSPVNLTDPDGMSPDPPPVDPNGNPLNLPEGTLLGGTFKGESYTMRKGGVASPVAGSLRSYQTPTGGGWITHTAHFNVSTGEFSRYVAGPEEMDEAADKEYLEQVRAEEQAIYMAEFNRRHRESGQTFLMITLTGASMLAAGGAVGLAFRMVGAGTILKESIDFGVDTAWEASTGTPSPFVFGFSDMAEGAGKYFAKKSLFKLDLPPSSTITKKSDWASGQPTITLGNQYSDLYLTNIQQVKPLKGFFDVAGHGSPKAIYDGTKAIKPGELANKILLHPDYNGQPVRLLGCNLGKGPNSFAEQLSRHLGAGVIAPNELIWARPSGRWSIGPTQGINSHKFKGFGFDKK